MALLSHRTTCIVWVYSTYNAGLNDAVVHIQLYKARARCSIVLSTALVSGRFYSIDLVRYLLGNKGELHTLAI